MTTIATLFSGGEGVGVGARMAGLAHLWGIEYDAAIADVARANGFHTITADVTQVDWSTLPAPDILHASPPCPNFSVAKTNRGETAQDRAVAQSVCAAIKTLLPRVFTLENVRGYASGYWPDSTPEEIEDRPKSLGMILDALTQCGYEYDLMIINSANYGVPQTRDRLYVIAMHGKRPPRLMPTHSKHGDMFTRRWIGWYEAIADLLDTLPPSQFAPWQLARLPAELRAMLGDTPTPITDEERAEGAMTAEEREEWEDRTWRKSVLMTGIKHMARNITLLDCESPASTIDTTFRPSQVPHAFIVNGTSDMAINGATEPAQTVVSTVHSKAAMPKAFIVGQQNGGRDSTIRQADAPAFTVTSSSDRQAARAFLVEGTEMRGDITPTFADDPAMTVKASVNKGIPRAFLVDSANTSRDATRLDADDPAMTVQAWHGRRPSHAPTAAVHGRVVAMTLRALARFQSFPDEYVLPEKKSLACRVIGNAVPPRLYAAIIGAVLEQV